MGITGRRGKRYLKKKQTHGYKGSDRKPWLVVWIDTGGRQQQTVVRAFSQSEAVEMQNDEALCLKVLEVSPCVEPSTQRGQGKRRKQR